MISSIIYIFYFIIFLFLTVTTFFIVYHFQKYSINASLNKIILPLFIAGSIILLLSNVIIFLSIDWSKYNTPVNFNNHAQF